MKQKEILQAATVGFMAGSRASTAPAITSLLLSAGDKPLSGFLSKMASKKIKNVLLAMVIPELVADKIPGVGDRIAPGGLLSRGITGGLGGAAIFRAAKKPALVGALTGAGMAIAAAYTLFYLRRLVAQKEIVPDAYLGMAEDALVLSVGAAMITNERKKSSAKALV